jgi:hypothetical protein
LSILVLDQLPAELEAALLAEQGRSGRTLEEVVVDLLQAALGLKRSVPRSNGLRELAGRWSEADQRDFDAAVAPFDAIDADLWR